jgi:hypothetical protein
MKTSCSLSLFSRSLKPRKRRGREAHIKHHNFLIPMVKIIGFWYDGNSFFSPGTLRTSVISYSAETKYLQVKWKKTFSGPEMCCEKALTRKLLLRGKRLPRISVCIFGLVVLFSITSNSTVDNINSSMAVKAIRSNAKIIYFLLHKEALGSYSSYHRVRINLSRYLDFG